VEALCLEEIVMTLPKPVVSLALCSLLLAGCHVTNDKNGKNDNVDISTPFGSMQVKTNNKTDTSSFGITAYPGAVPVSDASSADINMNFGSFHLGVKAAGFQTADSPDKVLAFYRKDLATRYGDVIECRNNVAVGTPVRTSQGLTCDSKHHNHISGSTDTDSDTELRTGSETRQHIVGVEAKNGGTHISLVMLNLPSETNSHGSKETE
jgi:hypothetical protein